MTSTFKNLKPIPYWPEYSITSDGRVWSSQSRTWLKPGPQGMKGHSQVNLYCCGLIRPVGIHVLVLETWVRLGLPGEVARHKNDIPTDNRVENLEWGTRHENYWDGVRNRKKIS